MKCLYRKKHLSFGILFLFPMMTSSHLIFRSVGCAFELLKKSQSFILKVQNIPPDRVYFAEIDKLVLHILRKLFVRRVCYGKCNHVDHCNRCSDCSIYLPQHEGRRSSHHRRSGGGLRLSLYGSRLRAELLHRLPVRCHLHGGQYVLPASARRYFRRRAVRHRCQRKDRHHVRARDGAPRTSSTR